MATERSGATGWRCRIEWLGRGQLMSSGGEAGEAGEAGVGWGL
jgi:hypothetical protein